MRLRRVFIGIVASLVATATLVAAGPSTPASGEGPTPGIAPDIVLTPNQDPFFKEYTSTMIGTNRTDPPDACRTNPAFTMSCDALRLKLNLSTKPGAQNYVVVELNWNYIDPPAVAVVVTALSVAVIPNMDLLVYRTPTLNMAPATVGGQVTGAPERIAFVAVQPEYDLVVKTATGFSQGYTIRAYMTDSIFSAPFESLDEVVKRAEEATPAPPFEDNSYVPPFEDTGDGETALAPLPEVTPTIDSQLKGVGLGVQEQFPGIDFGANQPQDVVAVGDPPSGLTLVVAMIVLPFALAVGGTLWLRRRRQALI